MCCGGATPIKPSDVLKAAQIASVNVAKPIIPVNTTPADFKIDPKVKADLIRQQQILRLKK